MDTERVRPVPHALPLREPGAGGTADDQVVRLVDPAGVVPTRALDIDGSFDWQAVLP